MNKRTSSAPANWTRNRLWLVWPFVLVAGIVGAIGWRPHSLMDRPSAEPESSFNQLLRSAANNLPNIPITRANLLCTESLPIQNAVGIPAAESLIKNWAQHVKAETDRHWYRYQQNSAEYENSPGFFRMLMLAVVLAEDYGIHYDPTRKGTPQTAQTNDGFFSDPDSVFLSGLLGPGRKGTCSSMPVLHVAVGRELGYPLKLVSTKGHLFVRWEGNGERFNVEATGHGLNRFDDDYYRHWPFEITPEQEQSEGYLKSMTPAEELAAFLSIRGMCLSEAGNAQQAAEAFTAATRLAPHSASYKRMLAILQNTPTGNAFK